VMESYSPNAGYGEDAEGFNKNPFLRKARRADRLMIPKFPNGFITFYPTLYKPYENHARTIEIWNENFREEGSLQESTICKASNSSEVKFEEDCQICLKPIDMRDNLMCPRCGQTWWAKCIRQAVNNRKKCPNWRKNISVYHLIKNFKFAGVADYIESNQKKKKAEQWDEHNEQCEFYCCYCSMLICNRCVVGQQHKSHQLKVLSDIKSKTKKKKVEIIGINEQLLDCLKIWEEKIQVVSEVNIEKLNDLEQEMVSKITNIFREYRREYRGNVNKTLRSINEEMDKLKAEIDQIENMTKEDSQIDVIKTTDYLKKLWASKQIPKVHEFYIKDQFKSISYVCSFPLPKLQDPPFISKLFQKSSELGIELVNSREEIVFSTILSFPTSQPTYTSSVSFWPQFTLCVCQPDVDSFQKSIVDQVIFELKSNKITV
jgi:hypothetical protein